MPPTSRTHRTSETPVTPRTRRTLGTPGLGSGVQPVGHVHSARRDLRTLPGKQLVVHLTILPHPV
ncbi:hypothetical protein Saa2_09258 [Streptomyces acidiscabies]|nr:hypothetical protein Saa2_09258 [Streptomyces acidiscabies]